MGGRFRPARLERRAAAAAAVVLPGGGCAGGPATGSSDAGPAGLLFFLTLPALSRLLGGRQIVLRGEPLDSGGPGALASWWAGKRRRRSCNADRALVAARALWVVGLALSSSTKPWARSSPAGSGALAHVFEQCALARARRREAPREGARPDAGW